MVLSFLRNFAHVLALLLWLAALFAFVGGLAELGWAIIAVVLVNGVFTFAQEYRASKLLEALHGRLQPGARVRRQGEVVTVSSRDVVPGDIICLEEGVRIPADARLIAGSDLEVDQSSLTGESLPVSKTVEVTGGPGDLTLLSNIVFSGSLVTHGHGEALIYATGAASQFGTVSLLTYDLEEAKGPLAREVEALSITTAVVAVATGISIWGISSLFLDRTVSEGLIFAIGIIVALVPEGLLPTLSLSLAIGAQRMARRNVLVRRLSAIEALGATQVICTDKTGTLTRNEMTVARLWTLNAEYALTGAGYAPEGELSLLSGEDSPDEVAELLGALVRASNASLARNDSGTWTITGDPTEGALVVAARKAGVSIDGERLLEFPFDALRRMMSTANRTLLGLRLHAKGAPDSLIERCAPVSDDWDRVRQSALEAADRYAHEGMRVLASAWRPLTDADLTSAGNLEHGLRFLGLVGIVDPVRPEVISVIDRCHDAGIRVVIVTGDHPGTAAAIALQAGVTRQQPHVVTGADLERMSPAALKAALGREVVFARTTPLQKLTIVTALQEMGSVVAVIGDGVNDAPSLRRADVGVAMGITGTDVAREAADIVLADDNFATIVDGIEEGRAIFSNIRKFVTYVFTSNVAELAPFAAYMLTGIPLPLKVIQVLAVDLGTDLVPALGLGAEPPEPGTLEEPPRLRDARLLDRAIFLRIFAFLGPIEAALGLAAFMFVYWTHGWRPGDALPGSGHVYVLATTMTYAAIVVGQIGAGIACRSATTPGLHPARLPNRVLLAGIALEVLVLVLIGRVPPLQGTFGFAALGWREMAFLLAVCPLLPLADDLRKRLSARRKRQRE